MITKEMINRINELAKKAKGQGLNDIEKKEQQELRKKYLEVFKKRLRSQLENIEIVD